MILAHVYLQLKDKKDKFVVFETKKLERYKLHGKVAYPSLLHFGYLPLDFGSPIANTSIGRTSLKRHYVIGSVHPYSS